MPHTEFRDGFNIAGDEVLREVVANHVIPAIAEALTRQGLTEPRALLAQLFGRDSIGMSQEERNTRVRLVRQIAVPVALGLLAACENEDEPERNYTCRLADFFEPDPVALSTAAILRSPVAALPSAANADEALPPSTETSNTANEQTTAMTPPKRRRARNRPPCTRWKLWCAGCAFHQGL